MLFLCFYVFVDLFDVLYKALDVCYCRVCFVVVLHVVYPFACLHVFTRRRVYMYMFVHV